MPEPVKGMLTINANSESRTELAALKAAFDHSVDGMVVLSTARRVLYMNPAAMELTDTDGDVVGIHCGVLFHCHDSEHPALQFDGCHGLCVLSSGQPVSQVEMNVRAKTGKVVPVEVTYSYVPEEDGSGPYLLMILRDVSDRKRMEKERKQKDELYYTLQERERLARDLHDGVVQDIAYANMQTKLLVEDLSKGKFPTNEELQRISDILESSFTELRRAIRDLTFRVSDDLLGHVRRYLMEYEARSGIRTALHCDKRDVRIEPFIGNQVAKILQEALNNIRKHAHATEVNVTLSFPENGKHLHLAVGDNGEGFEVEAKLSGDHFGLKNMHERCEIIGGTVTIESEMGTGTRVDIDVPL